MALFRDPRERHGDWTSNVTGKNRCIEVRHVIKELERAKFNVKVGDYEKPHGSTLSTGAEFTPHALKQLHQCR